MSSPAPEAGFYPRLAAESLRTALADTPVVLLHGPRQSGKTSLAQSIAEPLGYGYLTFDDDNLADAARADPVGFVADLPAKMVLDEVQRVPDLFTSLKVAADKDRAPGRFLLTGSSNILLLPTLADSLAGRLEAVRLHPLAQCEVERTGAGFLGELLSGRFESGAPHARLGSELAVRVAGGGYPAALARPPGRRRDWYRAYVQALLQRDVRDLARVAALDVLPRLMELGAARTAQLANISDLAGPFQVSRPTIRDYVLLLERLFLVELLPPWNLRRMDRLVKTPKLHLCDTGLACALLRVSEADLAADRELLGHMLETFVLQELRRQASAGLGELAFHHFRNRDGHEVDIVIEHGARAVVGVEVKAGGTVREADFKGLSKLREIAGPSFRRGVVLYDGERVLRFGEDMFAVPLSAMWDGA
ncbi:ATP-binding protein [Ramlibacter albus]|uniref:ATP-binding protein n=1 Tax=Ramlibacter albus TaxID=2079448 RepID=A0A923S3J4_9BURK|nr:ATP-binding protein [Ramlibacter albus]MBC5766505.1 ATP-binding protein [Ramlibacter albus]